jgi:hypothetical protein
VTVVGNGSVPPLPAMRRVRTEDFGLREGRCDDCKTEGEERFHGQAVGCDTVVHGRFRIVGGTHPLGVKFQS